MTTQLFSIGNGFAALLGFAYFAPSSNVLLWILVSLLPLAGLLAWRGLRHHLAPKGDEALIQDDIDQEIALLRRLQSEESAPRQRGDSTAQFSVSAF